MNKMEKMVLELMPNDKFNELLDDHIKYVKATMTKQKSFQPMLIAMTAKGQAFPCLFAELGETADDRVEQMNQLGRKMLEHSHKEKDIVIAVVFISEVWYAMADKKAELPQEVSLPLKDSPIKAEGIAISGSTLDGRQNMAVLPMMRAKDGTPMIVESKMTIEHYDESDKKQTQNFIMGGFWRGYLMALMGK